MAKIGPITAADFEARLLGSWSTIAHPEAGSQELAADARAVELYRTRGDRQALFAALCKQGRTQAHCHQLEQAELALHEAAQIFEASWPPALRAGLLIARSWLLGRQARFEESIGVDEELLQLAIALDDKRLALTALMNIEQCTAALGRLEESVARGREMANRIRQERSLRSGIENVVLGNLSMSLTALGEIDEALEVARRAYPSVQRAGRVLDLLDPYALLAFKRGHIDDAARVLGRADMRHATGNELRANVEQKLRDKLLLSLRDALSPDELSRLMKEGEALSDEDGARLALRE